MEQEQESLEASIKQRIGNHLGIKTSRYAVTWKPQERKSIDTEKMKEDGIYEAYCKTASNRVLRVALAEEKKNDVAS